MTSRTKPPSYAVVGLLLGITTFAAACTSANDDDTGAAESSDATTGDGDGDGDGEGDGDGDGDGDWGCESVVPEPVVPPTADVHGWMPSTMPSCGDPQVESPLPPCTGSYCMENVFCTDCELPDLHLRGSEDHLVWFVCDDKDPCEVVFYRIASDSTVEAMRIGLFNGSNANDIMVTLFQYGGEDIYLRSKNRSIVRISGADGVSSRLVQFVGDESLPGTPANDGRSIIVGRPDGWYLCSIPDTPGLSEQLDFVPKEDFEYDGTSNQPPIAYEGYILWKSRIYDTTTGEGTSLWPEYDIDAPDGRHALLGSKLYGHRSDPYPTNSPEEVVETHVYEVELPSGQPELLSTIQYNTDGLMSHAGTGTLVGSAVPTGPVPATSLILSVDVQNGAPSEIGAFATGDGPDGLRVVGDDLYLVRRASPGCLVRLPLVP